MRTEITRAARAVLDADRTVAHTGPGVSRDSGLPSFRGADGLWDRYDPDDFHVHRFEADPGGFWADWLSVYDDVFGGAQVAPNPGHDALAAVDEAGHLEAIVTEAVDGLYQAAGVADDRVLELHGNIGTVRCRSCPTTVSTERANRQARDGERPPRCPECAGRLKPGVVLFGEQLPKHAHFRAHALAEHADVFLVAGSALSTEPAASLPETAVDKGATLIVIGREETPLSGRAEIAFRENPTRVLTRLRDAIAVYSKADGVCLG